MFDRRVLLLALAASLVSACASLPAPRTVADTIATEPSLSTLSGLIAKAGLSATLQGPGPFTVFAPTNDAFKALPPKTLEALAQDPALLRQVLSYHVIGARTMAADVKVGSVQTLNGASLALARAGDFVTVEEAMVQTADMAASNGVVHSVDRVLMPPKK